MESTTKTNELVTESGLRPKYQIDVFEITSQDIQDYLQTQVDYLVKGLDQKAWGFGHIPVVFSADEIGRYVLFTVTFPENVLERRRADDYMSIYLPKQNNQMADPIYKFIRQLMYDQRLAEGFRSPAIKKEYNLNEKEQAVICRMMKPMVVPSNEGEGKNVIVAIDPILLFHNMLLEKEKRKKGNNDKNEKKNWPSSAPFKVRVMDCIKLSQGNMRFTIYRDPASAEKRKRRGGVNVPKLIRQTYGPGNYRNSENRYRNRR